MTETLVLVAAGGAAWESAGIRDIEAAPDLRLVRRCVDVAELLAVAPSSGAHAAVVAAGLPGLDADAVFRLERSGVRVVGVGDELRCQALGIAVRADASDVPAAVARLGSPVQRAEPEQAGCGRTVAVWGPSGAPGRSTVAVSSAAALAQAGQDCVLVDADTDGGSLAQMLSVLDEVSGLVAACRAANQGRAAETADHLLEVQARLRLLSGIPRADMATQIRAGALDLVLRQLRSAADVLVVDLAATLDPVAELVLGQADVLVVVGRADPVGLTRLVRALHSVRDVTTLEPLVVVNQMRPTLGWKERDVADTIARLTGRTPSQLVPSDVATLDQAIMRGEPPREVDPTSAFVQAIDRLVADIPLVRSAVSH